MGSVGKTGQFLLRGKENIKDPHLTENLYGKTLW